MMIVPIFFTLLQFGPRMVDETRAPMAIRPEAKAACKIAVSGQVWTGQRSMKGGAIEVRDLSGSGLLSVMGVLRFHFAGGRYYDRTWRHQTVGASEKTLRLTPEDTMFDGGLVSPVRVEGIVLGGYFGDKSTCGEAGNHARDRYLQSIESALKDAEEALNVANALPPALFAEALREGVVKAGPYARATTAGTNAMLRATLLSRDGKLLPTYKQWLETWIKALRPAK